MGTHSSMLRKLILGDTCACLLSVYYSHRYEIRANVLQYVLALLPFTILINMSYMPMLRIFTLSFCFKCVSYEL